MSSLKELSDQITKAMEGVYQEEWSIDRFKSEITGDEWGLIVCDGTIIAEIRGALDYCGNGENAEYIIATQPNNMRVILSALADAELQSTADSRIAELEQQIANIKASRDLQVTIAADEEERARKAEADLAEAVKVMEQIANAPAWGVPDRWETTPAEVRQLARSVLNQIAKGDGQ
jgi:hypothetical protein